MSFNTGDGDMNMLQCVDGDTGTRDTFEQRCGNGNFFYFGAAIDTAGGCRNVLMNIKFVA